MVDVNNRVSVNPNREYWLEMAVEGLSGIFKGAGLKLPSVKVSCGFASSGLRSKHIGECWTRLSNADGINQIYISPTLDDPIFVLETLTHELCHAIDDCQHKHGREFRVIAEAVGLEGPMRSTNAGPGLRPLLKSVLTQIGPYPHAKLVKEEKNVKASVRPKAKCKICGFEVTMIKKYLSFGPPICPKDNLKMEAIGDWKISGG